MKSVVIIGAAGFDYHLFLQYYKDSAEHQVLAFTVAEEQNLGTAKDATNLRTFPASLCGSRYPEGIISIPENQLGKFIREHHVDECVLAYSDISYQSAMRKAAVVLASGAKFTLLPPKCSQITGIPVPVLAVTAVRTGCGKSQTSTALLKAMQARGLKGVAVREPMPYGDLEKQAAMRFATMEDLDVHQCSVEEREEYEQYIEQGLIIYSGVDYQLILKRILEEDKPDVILFDGGNNEIPFFEPDIMITIADPLRVGEEVNSYPGEVNSRTADYLLINKENTADAHSIHKLAQELRRINPRAPIMHADSVVWMEEEPPEGLRGKSVLVVEDGPTTTHGGMSFGAGFIAAQQHGCLIASAKNLPELPVVRLSRFRKDSYVSCFQAFPHIADVLPAMGYNDTQRQDLKKVLTDAKVDYIFAGTPFDLAKQVGDVGKPILRIRYKVVTKPSSITLNDVVDHLLRLK